MRAKAAIVSLILVLAAFTPVAGAFHLSVGNYDSATTSEEDSGSPTVPPGSGKADPDGNLYERGLVTSGCYEAPEDADGTNAQSELMKAAPQDPICGRLMYNAGTEFAQKSPTDQDIKIDGWEFDGIHTTYVGAFSLSFNPLRPFGLAPTEPVYRDAHDLGNDLGLTDDGETAWNGDQGVQTFSPALLLPNAVKIATQESGAYEGNGWLFPYMDQSMMAFLTDGEGNPISEEDLESTVSTLKAAGQLPQSAQPTICGFTPDDEITIDAPQIGFCEVAFEYNDDGDSFTDGADFRPDDGDYSDPCESPTYVCGANNPGWYAQKVCNPGLSEECPTTPGVCQRLPGAAPCTEEVEQGDGFESTRDYDIWHWVVAPSEPDECPTVKEPGFLTASGSGDKLPYLAHDLDIYVTPTGPAADASGQDELRGLESVEEYTYAVADTYLAQVTEDPTGGDGPGALAPVAKEDRVEPNTGGDTSQSNIAAPAPLDDPCAVLADSQEQVADPWVDIVDGLVTRDLVGDVDSGPGDAKDPYLTSEDHQDASNRPGPGQYFLEGKIGVFTDRNDDGDYDQVGANDLFKDIQDIGAYPMFWDMRIQSSSDSNPGEPDLDAGCTLGFAQKKLTEQMVNAGYGPHTGLIQVLYLSHPATLNSYRTSDVIPITTPNTAIVFKSAGMETLRDQGDSTVQAAIQDALDRLPSQPAQVLHATDLTAPETDYQPQCGEPTGGFTSSWGFTHAAQLGGGGDTVVTEYVFQNEADNGEIGAGTSDIPPLSIAGEPYDFSTGVNQWFDVDPIDGDASRNNQDSSAPPH